MNIVTLSGWAQPPDALEIIAPGASHIDYASYSNPQNIMDYLRDNYATTEPDVIIGWSLGGQIAMRALAQQALKAKSLVIIAAPFQYVSCEEFAHGMGYESYKLFRNSYAKDAKRTSGRFAALIAKGDRQERDILPLLEPHNIVGHEACRWLPWLDDLARHSMRDYKMQEMPPTLIIHGKNDVVISVKQAEKLRQILPQARLLLLDECGHAPHLHNTKLIAESIREYVLEHARQHDNR